MYSGFFGLTSAPFSIAPNPDFMYLSPRHAEALAHLRYGLGEAGGFVLLTGEVGTGKTTVSRCLLQELDERAEVAFILNPTLSELELLAAICDELKMLTNLETNTRKLLQVILIGQPELQQLLKRNDLRQLAQRITARYHLLPLNPEEVKHYLKFRLQVAGCSRPVFSDAAVKKLFQLSGGIPRLLNLMADRALLGAYSQQQAIVSHKLVQQAAAEILPLSEQVNKVAPPRWFWPVLGLCAIVLGFSLAVVLMPLLHS